MTEAERVTIGITCYNARDTIERAIKSALAQDWPDVEILVVDDASGDGSADLVAEMLDGVDGARLIRHDENGGTGVARNTIVAEASGAFIAFFDDDDESLPGRIAAQVAAIRAVETAYDTHLIACYAGGERRYENGYVKPIPAIGAQGVPPHGPAVADNLLFYRRLPEWFYGSGVPTCALMARTSLFREMDGFDAQLRNIEDVDFAIRLALRGGWFIGTEQSLFIQHATDAPDKSPERKRDAAIAIAEKHRDYLRSVGRYAYARRWPLLRYHHFKRQYGRFFITFLAIFFRNPVAATRHILATGPRRLRHEHLMTRRTTR